VEKILRYQGGFYGMSGKNLKDRIDTVLQQLHLEYKRKEEPLNLSGGMKRRLMLAKALISNPKILILDEPTTGVDVELRHELWDFLREINKNGTTIFLTTHYIEEAEILCDRIGIINKGKLVELDNTKNLKKKYARNFIEIEISNLTNLNRALAGYAYIINENSVRIECERCTDDIGKIIKKLEKENIKINRLRVNDSTLESIYLDLTK
jgi:ABC-2 type transport system ATP-binding protein